MHAGVDTIDSWPIVYVSPILDLSGMLLALHNNVQSMLPNNMHIITIVHFPVLTRCGLAWTFSMMFLNTRDIKELSVLRRLTTPFLTRCIVVQPAHGSNKRQKWTFNVRLKPVTVSGPYTVSYSILLILLR